MFVQTDLTRVRAAAAAAAAAATAAAGPLSPTAADAHDNDYGLVVPHQLDVFDGVGDAILDVVVQVDI